MNGLFKQYNIKGIGTFINVLYLTAPILGIAMYFVNAMTFYTVANDTIHKYLPWMRLPIFLGLLIIAVLIMLFVFYKFIYPSYYSFLNKQTYIHDNPMQKDLAELLAKQKKIMKHLNIEEE